MSTLLVDCETFSELDVTKVGSRVYAKHPSTRVLLWSVRDPEWPRSLVYEEPDLWTLLGKLKKTNMIKWTRNEKLDLIHWSPFDRMIVQYGKHPFDHADTWDGDITPGVVEGPQNTAWCDLSILSLIHGGPAKLKWASKFWGGVEAKDDGASLITRFCSPQADGSIITKEEDPMRWEKFRAYAGQDTNVMVPILERFEMLFEEGRCEDLAAHWPYFQSVERMNERGAPIDRESALVAERRLSNEAETVKVEIEREYGFKIGSPKKVAAYLGTENAQRETLEDLIETNISPKKMRLAEARLLTSGAATKKLVPMIVRTEDDPRVYDAFLYWGAWTGRLTSSGIQLQNMVRAPSTEEYFEDLHDRPKLIENIFRETRNNIRGFIQSDNRHTLVAGDYNAVECRVSAWIAGEEWLIEAFRKGEDPYLIMASAIYGEDITDKDDPRRQMGKTVELGAQYGLGAQGLVNQCEQRGIPIDLVGAQRIINIYRELHPNIVDTWDDFGKIVESLIHKDPGESQESHGITFERTEMAIRAIRPSGFALYYWNPRMEEGQWPDGGEKWDFVFTGRGKGGMMGKTNSYGGKQFQGIVQGTAADLMLFGMTTLEANDFDPIMSAHDEIVCEIEDDGSVYIDDVCELLCVKPEWAEGLPLEAEGWQQRRFTK